MNLKIFQVFEILKSNRLQNKTKDRIFSWRDKLYLQIFGSVLIAVEKIYEEEIFFYQKIFKHRKLNNHANLNLY